MERPLVLRTHFLLSALFNFLIYANILIPGIWCVLEALYVNVPTAVRFGYMLISVIIVSSSSVTFVKK
jgi:hypothetical protein